jgi:hypothetical protein
LIRVWSTAFVTLSIATLGLGLAQRAAADLHYKKTVVTFSEPVEIPGKVLTPNCWIRPSERNIVEVYDKVEKKLYATILAVPDYRLKPSDKPLISFEERPSNTPEAIKGWFYPGDNYGVEFVYPHERAATLAKRTNQNVLSMKDDMKKNMATSATSASDAGIQQMQQTEVSGVNPQGDRVELTVVVATKPGQ